MAVLNRNIDILKYIMSLLIIMIHIGYSYEYPIVRVAVPVFFIISSYLFFLKINRVGEKEWNQILINFIIRALKLYVFWFIVLLPITVFVRRWYLLDFYGIIEQLIVGVLFKGTFLASWYISAYVIGIVLIFKLRKIFPLTCFFSIICYLLCCLDSNYYYICNFHINNWAIYNSFPAGLLFICIGKILAQLHYKSIKIGLYLVFIGFIGLIIENYYIIEYGLRKADDCYLSLMILAPGVFILLNSLMPLVKFNTVYLRNFSTIYYCSHYSLIVVLKVILGDIDKLKLLCLVILVCSLISVTLICLSKSKLFRWVKISY